MKKESKPGNEARILELLKRVLPKATADEQLAAKIYRAIENELLAAQQAVSFQKLCSRLELPDLETESLEEIQRQLSESFGAADVTVKPNRKDKTLAIEVALPDGTQLHGEIAVGGAAAGADDQDAEPEFKPKFIPFPVCLPGDKELVWLLAKRETLSPDEAGIALSKAEEEFWASKTGQKLLRDRVERAFPEFISRVPAGMLSELGLKRHYKIPEPIKVVRAGKRG